MSDHPAPGRPPSPSAAPTDGSRAQLGGAFPGGRPEYGWPSSPHDTPFSGASTLVDGFHGSEDRSPPPGQVAVVMAALMLGLLLMGTQLWLLTVALELYLGGHGRQIWLLALVSGLIFAGGVMVLRLLGRRPRLAR